MDRDRQDLRFEAELQQRTELIQGRHQDMKNVHRLMKDVKGIAEDMHTELKFQDKPLIDIKDTMDAA